MANKPYIVCHMMMSLDGRIDCAMTEQLGGVTDYYNTLNELNTQSTLSGRNTAELEMAEPGFFNPKNKTVLGKEDFLKNSNAEGYEIVVDTKGKLLWPNALNMKKPYLIITSEQVTKEYLNYLNQQNISWIACGTEKINLLRAMEILYSEFGVKRLSVVGGPAINTAFLNEKLINEISILIGAGIDGRKEMPSVFDGRSINRPLTHLNLLDVKKLNSSAVWLRYSVK